MLKIRKYAQGAILAACFGLVGFGSANAETLKVAVDVGYAPHVMAKASGGVEGYNVDLMAALAERMGVEYEIIDQEWSGIFAGLHSGKFDAIIVPTTERPSPSSR